MICEQHNSEVKAEGNTWDFLISRVAVWEGGTC